MEAPGISALQRGQRMRCDCGLASSMLRLAILMGMATSFCWATTVREVRRPPLILLMREMAVSTSERRPYPCRRYLARDSTSGVASENRQDEQCRTSRLAVANPRAYRPRRARIQNRRPHALDLQVKRPQLTAYHRTGTRCEASSPPVAISRIASSAATRHVRGTVRNSVCVRRVEHRAAMVQIPR
jgi:hypothetical protein